MGSGCCKTDDTHPITISQNHLRFNSESLKEYTDQTVTDSVNQLYRNIPWQRGDLIGEGVYGKVYQAMNLDTGELIAVKSYVLSNSERNSEKELRSIKHELKILKSLNHVNVIKYFQVDYDESSNVVDIVMEYVPSGAMNTLLNKYKKFSEPVIRNYTKQLLEGLHYLHSNEIIHRDLKSANILITENSTLKLTDFGCSRRFDSEVGFQSQSFKGSPYWMAPEVVTREGHSFSADIWSLGCLMIEMASGSPPWSNYSNLSKEVLKLIAKKDRLPDMPKCSQKLKNFISMCLQRDPYLRPNAEELLTHEFILQDSVAKCYDSIRSSTNVVSLKNSITETAWEKSKEL